MKIHPYQQFLEVWKCHFGVFPYLSPCVPDCPELPQVSPIVFLNSFPVYLNHFVFSALCGLVVIVLIVPCQFIIVIIVVLLLNMSLILSVIIFIK